MQLVGVVDGRRDGISVVWIVGIRLFEGESDGTRVGDAVGSLVVGEIVIVGAFEPTMGASVGSVLGEVEGLSDGY